MEKLLYLDLETTGLDKIKNGIIQISGIIEIDGDVKEKFNFNVKPFDTDVWDSFATQLAESRGITIDVVNTFLEPKDAYLQIINILSKYVDKYNKLDKFHLVGYNVSGFDKEFFYEWFKKNGDKYAGSYFWPIPIDVMFLASNYFSPVRHKLENLKLQTLCKFLNLINSGEFHDANNDIEMTKLIYHIVAGKKYTENKDLIEVNNDKLPWE